MSQEQIKAEQITKITGEQVAEFLRINPEFFESNRDLLSSLHVPHSSGEGTISLIERQVHVLRQQNESFKDQLENFASHALANEDLWFKFKDLSVMLLTSAGDKKLPGSIEDWLKVQFNMIACSISTQVKALRKKLKSDVKLSMLLDSGDVFCGTDLPESSLAVFFGDKSKKVKSCALIALKNEQAQIIGLLAFGSEDELQFSSEQSTHYLDCVSQLISKALSVS